ncbi:ABC transport system [Gracilibacillus boraciitolerans JCM 21714]|uniref:ABC transport system n=1 Tax=Gracilibacillus boraciitolerans JCM 21714 TaxID=1298598 RepID=W4VNT3_9BACI|nr:ABC transport system [Gracilibacillus boraciitolerans JCM 21714]
MKKGLLLCLLLMFLVGVLAACGGTSDSASEANDAESQETDETSEETTAEEGEQVTLEFFNGKVEIHDQALEMIKEFEAEHPNISVELETVGGGADGGCGIKSKICLRRSTGYVHEWWL